MRAKSLPVLRPVPTDIAWGPKMSELNERERAFVWHTVCNGGNGRAAAICVWDSDPGGGGEGRGQAPWGKDSNSVAGAALGLGMVGSLAITAGSFFVGFFLER